MIEQMTSAERDFDAAIFGWTYGLGSIDETALFHSSRNEEPYGFTGTNSARMDRLLDTLPLVIDREEAIPLWREYQQVILEEQPYTFVYFDERLDGISRRLRGVQMDARGEWINIKDWWIPREERGRARVTTR